MRLGYYSEYFTDFLSNYLQEVPGKHKQLFTMLYKTCQDMKPAWLF